MFLQVEDPQTWPMKVIGIFICSLCAQLEFACFITVDSSWQLYSALDVLNIFAAVQVRRQLERSWLSLHITQLLILTEWSTARGEIFLHNKVLISLTRWARRPLGSSEVSGSHSFTINSSILLRACGFSACLSAPCVCEPMLFLWLSTTAASAAFPSRSWTCWPPEKEAAISR